MLLTPLPTTGLRFRGQPAKVKPSQAVAPMASRKNLERRKARHKAARNNVSRRAAASILIVDDNRDFCRQAGAYLTNFGYAVHAAHSGVSDLEHVLAEPWQAIILNASLADFNGLDLLRRIRQESNVPVLLISARPQDTDEVAALEAGADAYLPMGSSGRQLLAHLHAVVRRAAAITSPNPGATAPPREIVIADLRILPEAHRATLKDHELVLTPSEFAVLLSLAKASGRVKTRDCLYEEIRDREYGAFDRALDMLVCSLRRKLGDHPRSPRFIRTVRSAGYMLVNPDAA